ncbi:protein phosphatase 2C domain-containing protein [Mycetocola sp. 2940]|uniref:PP2C family protein-serine/threonine phosphatase n=1 Tax=Mycetocola sp. 2940 TaxID=3156452 RepID=UPI00339782EA
MTAIDVRTGSRVVDVPSGAPLALSWASVTDTGRKRQVNQDALIVDYPIFAVADGMGGHDAGEVASAAVIARLAERVASGDTVDRDAVENALRAAVDDMLEQVGTSELGTGTTVTGIVFGFSGPDADVPAWTVFNIGDSRVYRLLGEELIQVTLDHSVVQELISIGAITPDEAESHPHGNVITRAVGFTDDPLPDYTDVPSTDRARWLVCSDGLTKELTDFGLRHFLMQSKTPEEAVRSLVGAALDNGGRDNVSAIVLDELLIDHTGPSVTGPA